MKALLCVAIALTLLCGCKAASTVRVEAGAADASQRPGWRVAYQCELR
jgi:hypothetical protein